MGLAKRIFDVLLVFWLLKSVVISLLVEYPMAKYRSDWPKHAGENPMLQMVLDQINEYNFDDLILQMPDHLTLSTWMHIFWFAPCYLITSYGLIFKKERLSQIFGFIIGVQLFNSLNHYFVLEMFTGDQITKNPLMFTIFNLDYYLGAFWLIIRFWPFTAGSNNKNKRD